MHKIHVDIRLKSGTKIVGWIVRSWKFWPTKWLRVFDANGKLHMWVAKSELAIVQKMCCNDCKHYKNGC